MANTLTIVGRLTDTPETKTSKNGTLYCQFSIAENCGTGDTRYTQYYHCTSFGNMAEKMQNFEKANMILVSGKIVPDEYTTRTGTHVISFKVTAERIERLLSNERNVNGMQLPE